MAKEKKVNEIIREAGYDPEEGKAIVVKYAPGNLSDRSRVFSASNIMCFRYVRIRSC